MVAQTYNSSNRQAEAGPQSDFQDRQGDTEKPCLEKQKVIFFTCVYYYTLFIFSPAQYSPVFLPVPCLPFFPLLLPFFYLQYRVGLLVTSTVHGTTRNNKTRHKPSHQVLVKQLSRRQSVLRPRKRVRDSPLSGVHPPNTKPTSITYIQKT